MDMLYMHNIFLTAIIGYDRLQFS